MIQALVFLFLSTPCMAEVDMADDLYISDSGYSIILGDKHLDIGVAGDVEILLSYLYSICNHYSTCQVSIDESTLPDSVRKIIDCCVPCDCSDRCYAVGNCCKDKIYEPPLISESEPQEHCVITNPINRYSSTSSFMMVTGCAQDYQGEATVKCSGRFSAIEDFVPVYSDQDERTYRNIHCARCNNQEKWLVPWNITTRCTNYSPLSNQKENGLVLHGECQMHLTPNSPYRECFIGQEQTKCTEAKYKELCTKVPEGYGFVEELRDRVCNGYCALPNFCVLQTFVEFTYEALLNFDGNVGGPSSVGISTVKTKCPEGQTFNTIVQACLHLTCSPSQRKVDTPDFQCIEFFRMVRGVCLDYRVKVTVPFADDVLLASKGATALAHEVFPRKSGPFEPEILSYLINTDTDTIAFIVRVTEQIDDYVEIQQRFNQFRNGIYNGSKINQDFKIDMTGSSQPFQSVPLDEVSYVSYLDSPISPECRKTVAMNRIQFCKMVMFSPGDFHFYEGGVVLKNGRQFHAQDCIFRETRDGETYVQICLETYMHTYRRRGVIAKSGCGAKATEWSTFIVLVIFNILSLCGYI